MTSNPNIRSYLYKAKKWPALCCSSLKAFTIMELLVTMVISGIVIAASLKLYMNYESLLSSKNKQMDCSKQTLQFYQVFKNEFDNSLWMKSAGDEVTFMFPAKSSVQYEFEQDYIVRLQEDQTDTFFIKANDLTILKDSKSGFDNIVTMELNSCGEIYPISLIKQYSNDLMMNKQCQ